MRRHAYWPTAAELRPYVEWAAARPERPGSEAAPRATLEELRELHEQKMARLRASIRYSDEEILAWEVARGTMMVEEG